MDRVRWGIIGVGDVTERKSGPAFQQAERSELVAVMRRDAAKAEDWARRHGVGRWYADADALIADPEVDAVYVATPPDSHADYAQRVAAAGKPVYVEKPMARDAAECDAMVAAAERAGTGLWVAYYRRALPRFRRVRELLATGRVGRPRSVLVRTQQPARSGGELPWREQPEVSGGGYLVDLGSHTLDLLDWLFGPVTEVTGGATSTASTDDATAPRAEDQVTATLAFASGVRGVGLWDFAAAERVDRVEVVGDGGSLVFSCFGSEPLRLLADGREELVRTEHPDPVQLPLVQSVVDELTGHGTCPSTGRTALRTAQVLDALLADHRAAEAARLAAATP
ncbi:gfo/Idh/MocA family oxidoreductase [Desertihabitans brevis]|uniref:Gfo/Idh/MocA family oxidoreductase n=1 Tax=Desertihabitans brevis TaxID=2268447 RepID=A0A367YVA5_9ACTN|nr:Gfo/Idh/MocA family oxidoreductase [Desertihabitans brevis]RCK69740.1 gfo/Idh/MocA family oxidoreductase [Desertihabitans brevis]